MAWCVKCFLDLSVEGAGHQSFCLVVEQQLLVLRGQKQILHTITQGENKIKASGME